MSSRVEKLAAALCELALQAGKRLGFRRRAGKKLRTLLWHDADPRGAGSEPSTPRIEVLDPRGVEDAVDSYELISRCGMSARKQREAAAAQV